MTTTLILIAMALGLGLLWAAATLAGTRPDPPAASRRGESRRQQELIERALELQGVVPDEFWPHVAPRSASDTPSRETASVS